MTKRSRDNGELAKGVMLRRFLLGLPAITVVCGAVGLAERHRQAQDKLSARYHRAATSALKEKDWATAGVYYRKLAWLDETDPSVRYGLAIVADEQGDAHRAEHLMKTIATADAAGFGPAHLWLARRYLQTTPVSAALVRAARHHLKQSVQQSRVTPEAHHLYGLFCLTESKGRDRELLNRALVHLKKSSEAFPDDALTVGTIHRSLGNLAAAQTQIAKVISTNSVYLEKSPNDPDTLLRLARAHVVIDEYTKAIELLQTAIGATDNEVLKSELATICVTWARRLAKSAQSPLSKRLDLYEVALNANPADETALRDLVGFTRGPKEVAARTREMLMRTLAVGGPPATVHLLLGLLEMNSGGIAARQHFEEALSYGPRMPDVLNNLAWDYVTTEPIQPEKALTLIDLAISVQSNPEHNETKGLVLMKLNRHEEALRELLVALRDFNSRASLHQHLAECYTELQNTEMAQRHKELAEKLAGK